MYEPGRKWQELSVYLFIYLFIYEYYSHEWEKVGLRRGIEQKKQEAGQMGVGRKADTNLNTECRTQNPSVMFPANLISK